MNRIRDLLADDVKRRVEELHDDSHRRQELGPMDELALSDARVEAAGLDEMDTMWDPDTHPRAHRASDPDEPICNSDGEVCDIMEDTAPIDSLTVDPGPGEEEMTDADDLPTDVI